MPALAAGARLASVELLRAGAAELGLTLTSEQIAAFRTYSRELLEWNQRINLTAITDEREVETRHFLDSLTCLLALAPRHADGTLDPDAVSGSAVDVGAGAGFPGLPLAIVCPGLRVTLIESVGKKGRFLEHTVAALGLANATVVVGRAEDLARHPRQRDRHDYALARALAPLPVLLEYCLPFLRPGGLLVAPKKGDVDDELRAAQPAVRALHGRWLPPLPVNISLLPDGRLLIVVEKAGPTPPMFPRRAGLPAKQPLGLRRKSLAG